MLSSDALGRRRGKGVGNFVMGADLITSPGLVRVTMPSASELESFHYRPKHKSKSGHCHRTNTEHDDFSIII